MTRALVIGASMSGLLVARVLSRHFGQVEIVERDRLPDGPEFRNGVPQSRHAHALLRAGLDALNALFPGFGEDLERAGAVPIEPPRELPWLNAAGWSGRFGLGLNVLSCSRELLESLVRSRLRSMPNVRFRTRTEAVGLMHDQGRVTGVRATERDGSRPDSSQFIELSADLVVDASGRMSRTPEWLQEAGYDRPREVIINSHLGYASRVFRRPAGRYDWKGLLIGSSPDLPRGAGVFPLEADRWIVTLGGYGRSSHPPIDEAGYMDFIRSLRTQVLFKALQDAEPLTPIYGYARTENARRHYELLERRPEGLIVIGDATCCFNPIYGQGMSVAGLAALAVDRCMRESPRNGIAMSAQRAIARVCDNAWLLATGEDLRYPTTEGAKGSTTPAERLIQRYFGRVILRSNQDQVVGRTLTRVIHLLDPPAALFEPRVLARVLMPRSSIPGEEPKAGRLDS